MAGEPAFGRRKIRHEATKEEILEAAWRLARVRGLAGFSLRDLAQAVQMRHQSLYTYFPSKQAIYDAMFAQGFRALADQRAASAATTSLNDACHPLQHRRRGFLAGAKRWTPSGYPQRIQSRPSRCSHPASLRRNRWPATGEHCWRQAMTAWETSSGLQSMPYLLP
jgi:AcrR family transcriptional regulator